METKKKILIFVVVILLIAVIGAVYYFMINSSKKVCDNYTDISFNIDRECIIDIWNNVAGCPNTPSDIIDYYEQTSKQTGTVPNKTINNSSVAAASRTLSSIISDAKAWAKLPDTNHRTKCYGNDTSKWPAV